MSNKPGRNDPCPCGSGLKYKKCHGETMLQNNEYSSETPFNQGILVNDNTVKGGEILSIGSPGGLISNIVRVQGTTENLNESHGKYFIALYVDIPILLPLNDGEKYTICFEGDQFDFFHSTKKRGEEFYSTLESSKLPFFSSIQIQGKSFDDSIPLIPQNEIENKSYKPPYYKSYRLILYILKQIIDFTNSDYLLNLDKEPRLSYYILYYKDGEFPNGKYFAKATYPYSGLIDLKGPEFKNEIDNTALKRFLSEQFKIQSYSLKEIVPNVQGKSFEEKVFLSAHDFSYYCTQHPLAISKLMEPEIRDLYLIILKSIFTYAEGETFNFQGKLDFKITDKSNKYLFIAGEFKIWSSEHSIIEAFDQVVRFHNSGQEMELYILMINKNKNITSVRRKIKESISKEVEYIDTIEEKRIPTGSSQIFDKYILSIRDRQVPLNVGLINLYLE